MIHCDSLLSPESPGRDAASEADAGAGDLGDGSTRDTSSDAGDAATSCVPLEQVCVGSYGCGAIPLLLDLDRRAPAVVEHLLPNRADASCGAVSAPELWFSFRAPHAGRFAFSASGYGGTLAVYASGDCQGQEIACGGGHLARLYAVARLAEAEEVLVALEGAADGRTLRVQELTQAGDCADPIAIAEAPTTVRGFTLLGDGLFETACGISGVPEAVVDFTAPRASVYSFDAEGSDFRAVLRLADADCALTNETACGEESARLLADLEAGERIRLVIQGTDPGELGQFVLEIRENPPGCERLQEVTSLPFSLDVVPHRGSDIESGCELISARAVGFSFVPPSDGTYVLGAFNWTNEATLSVRSGSDCEAPLTTCSAEDFGPLKLTLEAGEPVAVVVEGTPTATDTFRFLVDQLGTEPGTCAAPEPLLADEPHLMTTARGFDNGLRLSCSARDAVESVFSFEAPQAGYYTFNTGHSPVGSIRNAALAIVDGNSCQGRELACNTGYVSFVEASAWLVDGQRVLLVIESPRGFAETLVLNHRRWTDPASCQAPTRLPSRLQTSGKGKAVPLGGSSRASCFSPRVAEVFEFAPPESGTYRVAVHASNFDDATTLGIVAYSGNQCEVEVACTAAVSQAKADLVLELDKDVPIQFHAEALTGRVSAELTEFGFSVERIAPLGASCTSPLSLQAPLPIHLSGDTVDEPGRAADGFGDAEARQAVFTFEAPEDGVFTFSRSGNSNLNVLKGVGCDAPLLGTHSIFDDQTSVPLAEGDIVTLVLEANVPPWSTFALGIERAAPPGSCSTPAQLAADWYAVHGSTFAARDEVTPSCAVAGSPEAVFQFVPPEDGLYTFSVTPSFDSVLAVFAAPGCGEEIACNDDIQDEWSDTQSQLSVELLKNQTVSIVVDGTGGEVGDFELYALSEALDPCCRTHAESGCEDEAIEICVCDIDPECCSGAWDETCVGLVEGLGCSECR